MSQANKDQAIPKNQIEGIIVFSTLLILQQILISIHFQNQVFILFASMLICPIIVILKQYSL